MQGLYRLAENVIVLPVMNSIMTQMTWRVDNGVLLRIASKDTSLMARVQGVKPLALNIMSLVSGSVLGTVGIQKVDPGKKFLTSAQPTDQKRYCVVLQGLPGLLQRVDDETVNMRTGEVWWIDQSKETEVINNSTDDAIQLLIHVQLD